MVRTISARSLIVITSAFVIVLVKSQEANEHRKQKRQLFREQVLPDVGGKIPDYAYDPGRISLNALNKNGLAYNGYVLEPSKSISKYENKINNPEILRLSFTENRSVFTKGDLASPNDVYTAYIIRKPSKTPLHPPIPLRYNSIPVFPYSSLKLIYRYKQDSRRQNINPCLNDIFPNGCLSDDIFKQFGPILAKIHQL